MPGPTSLIAYTSVHGNTREIVQRIGETLRERGFEARAVDLGREGADPAGYDLVVAGGSVHRGAYAGELLTWLDEHADALGRPWAAFSVSLLAAGTSEEDREEVAGYLADLQRHGTSPALTASFAGALQYREYRRPIRWIMRRIARSHDLSTDTSRDHVLTDWGAVERFAGDAATLVTVGRPVA